MILMIYITGRAAGDSMVQARSDIICDCHAATSVYRTFRSNWPAQMRSDDEALFSGSLPWFWKKLMILIGFSLRFLHVNLHVAMCFTNNCIISHI